MLSVWSGSPSDILYILELTLVVLLGLAFGSFATMMAHRGYILKFGKGGQGDDSKSTRSQCPKCQAKLGIFDLIPLLSWLFQRGKCRHCKVPISPIYPAIEVSVLLMSLSFFFLYGFESFALLFCVIAASSILVGLAVYDLRHKILPNQMVLVLAILGLVYRFWPSSYETGIKLQAIEYLGGAALYAVLAFIMGWVMQFLLKKPALGMGDVKFFGAAGLWLGISQLGAFCILSGVLGVALGIGWQYVMKEKVFPFGPALIASFYVVLLLNGSLLP